MAGGPAYQHAGGQAQQGHDPDNGETAARFLDGLLGIGFLIFGGIGRSDGRAVSGKHSFTAPEVPSANDALSLRNDGFMNFLQTVQGQGGTGLTVRAGSIRGSRSAVALAQGLGLADGLAAGGAGLRHLPQKGPKGQAQVPEPLAGMLALVLLGQTPVGNPGSQQQFQLVDSNGAGGAPFLELPGEGAGPRCEIGCAHRQRIYCLIDSYASLFFMSKSKATQTLPAEYQHLRKSLARIGWIALGSLLERSRPGQGGPRYQWSRRVGNKTVTVALSPEQFAWLKEAITNQRLVWDALTRMQQLSARHALEKLPNPPRRKRLSKKRLGLN